MHLNRLHAHIVSLCTYVSLSMYVLFSCFFLRLLSYILSITAHNCDHIPFSCYILVHALPFAKSAMLCALYVTFCRYYFFSVQRACLFVTLQCIFSLTLHFVTLLNSIVLHFVANYDFYEFIKSFIRPFFRH